MTMKNQSTYNYSHTLHIYGHQADDTLSQFDLPLAMFTSTDKYRSGFTDLLR